jgi:hypothetical protein
MAAWVDLDTGVRVGNKDGDDLMADQVVSGGKTLGDGVGVASVASDLERVNGPLVCGLVDQTALGNLEPDSTVARY